MTIKKTPPTPPPPSLYLKRYLSIIFFFYNEEKVIYKQSEGFNITKYPTPIKTPLGGWGVGGYIFTEKEGEKSLKPKKSLPLSLRLSGFALTLLRHTNTPT
jgi:hypothetical protein